MNDKLANDLIGLYEKGLEEFGVEIIDVKYGGRAVTLLAKVDGETKEYTAAFQGGTVLDSHVAVLRKAYWEKKDPPKPKPKPKVELTEEEEPMKTKLTYKDIYKQ